ncbi:MAG: DUF1837 domain-containing protein [Oligoflexales bacterium]|nr:DUF1837 domain-containing protein [Oligoflexales bacterium]
MADHLKTIVLDNAEFKISSGKSVEVYRVDLPTDDTTIENWAKHFRNQYCTDEELIALVEGTGKSKGEFLCDIIFPDERLAPGPSVRSGDFSEALLSDFLEFTKQYWVPRNRFQSKAARNESVKGSDIIAIKTVSDSSTSIEDVLAIFESKGNLSAKNTNTLKNAIEHSAKDYLRLGETLNAIKRRYINKSDVANANKISRFQNLEDNPYKEYFGAVAFCTSDSINDSEFFKASVDTHPNKDCLHLFVFHGNGLMNLAHKLYRKAIDDAGS